MPSGDELMRAMESHYRLRAAIADVISRCIDATRAAEVVLEIPELDAIQQVAYAARVMADAADMSSPPRPVGWRGLMRALDKLDALTGAQGGATGG